MKTTTSSVEDARRDLADLINRAMYADTETIILRRGYVVAKIVPASDAEKKMYRTCERTTTEVSQ